MANADIALSQIAQEASLEIELAELMRLSSDLPDLSPESILASHGDVGEHHGVTLPWKAQWESFHTRLIGLHAKGSGEFKSSHSATLDIFDTKLSTARDALWHACDLKFKDSVDDALNSCRPFWSPEAARGAEEQQVAVVLHAFEADGIPSVILPDPELP